MNKQVIFHERYVPGQVEKRVADDHENQFHFVGSNTKGKVVLDAACGAGRGALLIAQYGAKWVDAFDIDPEAIAYASRHFHHVRVDYQVADVESVRYPGRYDAIVCLNAIEHFEDVEGVLARFWTSLKAGGELWISSIDARVRRHDAYSNPHHCSEMTCGQMYEKLTACGFLGLGVYGQRPVSEWRTRRHLLNRILNKIFGRPEETAPSEVQPWRAGMRYYLIHAQKRP